MFIMSLGIGVGSFSSRYCFFTAPFALHYLLWWFGVSEEVDTGVTKPFLCSSAVLFNFTVIVLVIP